MELIADNQRATNRRQNDFRIILYYNMQYRQVEKINNKHWSILKKGQSAWFCTACET